MNFSKARATPFAAVAALLFLAGCGREDAAVTTPSPGSTASAPGMTGDSGSMSTAPPPATSASGMDTTTPPAAGASPPAK